MTTYTIGGLINLANSEQQRFVLPSTPDDPDNLPSHTGYAYLLPFNNAGTGTPVKVGLDVLASRCIRAAAIMWAESGGDPQARCYNINDPVTGKPTCSKTPPAGPRGVDRGLWQFNSVYFAQLSDAAAFDPVLATRAAYQVSEGFTAWGPWAKSRGMQGPGNGPDGKPTPLQLALDAYASSEGVVIDKGIFGLPGETAVYQAAATILGAPASMLEAAQQALRILWAAAQWIADPHNWVRILQVIGGAGLVVIGSTMLVKDVSPAAALAKVAGR